MMRGPKTQEGLEQYGSQRSGKDHEMEERKLRILQKFENMGELMVSQTEKVNTFLSNLILKLEGAPKTSEQKLDTEVLSKKVNDLADYKHPNHERGACMTKERNKIKEIFNIEKQLHKDLVKLREEMDSANKRYQRETVEQKLVNKKEEFNQKKEIVLGKMSNVKLQRGKENGSFLGSINNPSDHSKKRKLVDAEATPAKRSKIEKFTNIVSKDSFDLLNKEVTLTTKVDQIKNVTLKANENKQTLNSDVLKFKSPQLTKTQENNQRRKVRVCHVGHTLCFKRRQLFGTSLPCIFYKIKGITNYRGVKINKKANILGFKTNEVNVKNNMEAQNKLFRKGTADVRNYLRGKVKKKG